MLTRITGIVVLFVILFLCVFWLQNAIDPFVLFHHSVYDHMCFTMIFGDWEKNPLQIEHIIIIWSCIRIRVRFRASKTGLSTRSFLQCADAL